MSLNLAAAFEEAAAGEPIEAAVIGEHYTYSYSDEQSPTAAVEGQVIPWDTARPLLDYTYDNGYGGADCNAVYAWTASRVLFVHEYDGATGVQWVPRGPIACAPEFGGMWS